MAIKRKNHGIIVQTSLQFAPFTLPVIHIFAREAVNIGPKIIIMVVNACTAAETPIPMSTNRMGLIPPFSKQENKQESL